MTVVGPFAPAAVAAFAAPATATTKRRSVRRSETSLSVLSSRSTPVTSTTTSTTTPMIKRQQRRSDASLSLASIQRRQRRSSHATTATTSSSSHMDQAMAQQQRQQLLQSLDALASHLPQTVLQQLVKQVVNEENESQILSLLGKSIEILRHSNSVHGQHGGSGTANSSSAKTKTSKAATTRRKLPSRSKSLRSILSGESVKPTNNKAQEEEEEEGEVGFTKKMEDDYENSFSTSSATSSIDDDMTWFLGDDHDNDEDHLDNDGTNSDEDEDEDELDIDNSTNTQGTIGASNLSRAGLMPPKSDTNLMAMMILLDEHNNHNDDNDLQEPLTGTEPSTPASPPEEDDQEVAKLCQGRLSQTMMKDNSLHESLTVLSHHSLDSDSASASAKSGTPSQKSANNRSINTGGALREEAASIARTHAARIRLDSSRHTAALLFVDISGFTKLSRSLEVESLSKVINSYFEKIVEIIHAYHGDVLKFAGDALLVEWKQPQQNNANNNKNHNKQQQHSAPFLAAICAARLVGACSDFHVQIPPSTSNNASSTALLNIHCAIGYGTLVCTHVGSPQRMEYVVLGEVLGQVEQSMKVAKLGEVVASPETIQALQNTLQFPNSTRNHDKDVTEQHQPMVIAYKSELYFRPKDPRAYSSIQLGKTTTLLSQKCQGWNMSMLRRLYDRMAPYVHPVVLNYSGGSNANASTSLIAGVVSGGNGSSRSRISISSTASRRQSLTGLTSAAGVASAAATTAEEAELRDVLTIFLQPILPADVELMSYKADSEHVLALLQKIMMIVQSEVEHFQGQLRQFIVDDKGLVLIINFGLRGSTFPNMVEERAMPCISNIQTLLRTELAMESRMGATSGKAYCGVVGGVYRGEYSVLGPSVNLAARLMGNKDNPGVLVDLSFKQKAKSSPFIVRRPIVAKGYDEPVKIYEPARSVRKAWLNISKENFVGRSEEMTKLTAMASNILDNPTSKNSSCSSEMVFISAPYGYGKSCLLSHATCEIEDLCRERSSSFHVSRHVFCEDDSFKPFSIVRPLFLDILRGKQESVAVNRRRSSAKAMQEESRKQDEAQLYLKFLQVCLQSGIPGQYIEMFAGMLFSDKLSDDIGKWSDKNQRMSTWNLIAWHLVRVYLHMTASFDLVLLALDDVSSMDEMSWKIVQRLIHVATGASSKFLILGTARNEYGLNIQRSLWDDLSNGESKNKNRREPGFSYMRLEPMSEKDISQLATKRSQQTGDIIGPKVARTVYFLSEGNPFLACEILDHLYSSISTETTIQSPNKSENSGRASAFAAAEGVQEILLNRLDSLPASVRLHLQCGAMLGDSFSLSDIFSVMEKYNDISRDIQEQAEHIELVCKSLEEAEQNGFLSSTKVAATVGGSAVVLYTFSHPLWREAISQQILQAWKDKTQRIIDCVLHKNNPSKIASNGEAQQHLSPKQHSLKLSASNMKSSRSSLLLS